MWSHPYRQFQRAKLLNLKLVLISVDMKTGVITELPIAIRAETELSSRLDPEEINEEKKLGEGSFGVVFKGNFRGNIVAIKKMKVGGKDKKSIEDFENEVSMLEKFRSEYRVFFWGGIHPK
ncbi:protein serine/threonine kinase, putative [Entamoeba invadens IP1]|uniref:Protein serine/threonine kinase, putative n=1 Tax=Entamoeba invadens IP1 TaxID=370355 RepID=A0A0A1TU66_ENTIV|nr:protein serine/threonine kinase, putative [Entamoeba invadens IP1]ELP83454.1 protein serine/threonine kinase, putative [Entamoeba invadens IP1]|eukprot:XP_004182800.1 protein serine/threonine kinase, putative [Entamoeba invadens IP1]